jgi:hypothetical protein
MAHYLFENLRIEEDRVRGLDAELMSELSVALKSRKVHVCAALIQTLRRRG